MIPERVRPLLEFSRPIGDRFAAEGFRLYLVGGVVRDLLLGVDLSDVDYDFTTDAPPEVTKRLLAPGADALWTQGERFGTIGAKIGGRDVEVTTHRAEAYSPDSRKPEVEFASEVEADLSRRDFTVNAMALDVTESAPRLIDPFDGAADLMARRLRTPLSPEISFIDDPLRMMRAARFMTRLGLEPDGPLIAAAKRFSPRLEIVSAERIRDELDRLMVTQDPTVGLWFVVDTGLASVFLPELPAMRVEQDPIHRHKDVLAHTIAVVAKTDATREPRLVVRLAALFHDIGKPKTKSIGTKGVSFHHHDVVGARLTRDRMKALRYSTDMTHDVSELVALHLRFHTYKMGWTDAAVRRFVRDAGPLLDELIELTRSDCTTRNKRKAAALAARMDQLEARIEQLAAAEELKKIRPDLDGRAVMVHLGVEPGPLIGEALDHLLELRLEHGPLGEERAYAELDDWWSSRSVDG